LTLNLGVRFEKEYLPPYSAGNPSVSFSFTDKVAPRIGGAYDLLHNGKVKIFASYGKFYDIMKYSLPRGSFGGDYWHDCFYTMDVAQVDYTTITPTNPGGHSCGPTFGPTPGITVGTFIAQKDWRARLARAIGVGIESYRALGTRKQPPLLVADYRKQIKSSPADFVVPDAELKEADTSLMELVGKSKFLPAQQTSNPRASLQAAPIVP